MLKLKVLQVSKNYKSSGTTHIISQRKKTVYLIFFPTFRSWTQEPISSTKAASSRENQAALQEEKCESGKKGSQSTKKTVTNWKQSRQVQPL